MTYAVPMPDNAAPRARLLRPGEVCRLLKISPDALRRRVLAGKIRCTFRGAHRRFSRDEVLAQQAELLAEETDQGKVDRCAIEMMERGSTDAEVIRTLGMPLERARALRQASGNAPTEVTEGMIAPPLLEEQQRAERAAVESYTRRRAELSAKRRSYLEPTAAGRRTKKKETAA